MATAEAMMNRVHAAREQRTIDNNDVTEAFWGHDTEAAKLKGIFEVRWLFHVCSNSMWGNLIMFFLVFNRIKFLDDIILQVLFFDLLFWKGYRSILIS